MRCWFDMHDPDKTVFLAGCGRSGTTWLSEILNYRNTFRMMFEPFYPARVPELQGVWKPQQYLRPGAAGPGPELARGIIAGRVRNQWVDQFNTRRIARRRLIKEVRFNLALDWLHREYPAIPIIFLIRHPIPTALSQLTLKWKLKADLFLNQPELMADWLEPHRKAMEAARDPLEAQVLIWCLMNWVLLRQFSGGGLHVVFYEDLCRRPESVLPALFDHAGVKQDPRSLSMLHRPSALSGRFSAVLKGEDSVESWRGRIAESDLRRALDVLGRFGLDRIYGPESMPRVQAGEVLPLFRS